MCSTGSEKLEQAIAAVPGLMIALFKHGTNENKKKNKRSKGLGRVTFSEEVNTDIIDSYESIY